VLAVFAAMLATAGCGSEADIREGDVRTYRVERPAVATVAARKPDGGNPAAARLRYEVPDGWSDRGASGMRLATLAIGPPDTTHEVTVIPAAGSLESNVARWAGQLDAAADDEAREKAAAAAIAAAETVDIDGASGSVVLLLDAKAAAGEEGGEAILGAMIPVDDASSLFVKYKGDAAVARREREKFVRFVSSIRWK